MNIKGNYVQLSYNSTKIIDKGPWCIPFNEQFTISTAQKTRQPVKDFFDNLNNAIVTTIGNSKLAATVKGAEFLYDLLGVRFFQKDYYASSWVGEEPAEISLKLHFFRGMKGDSSWDSYTEVYNPISQIMAATVPFDPSNSDLILTAPMPNSLQVFTNFAGSIVESTITSISSLVTGAISLSSTTQGKGNNTNMGISSQTTVSNLSGGTWTLNFGYSSDGRNIKPYITMGQLICTNSSFSFSPTLAKNGGNYYPIAGDLNLTFKTQSILVSTDFKKG